MPCIWSFTTICYFTKYFSNPPSNKSNIYERDWFNFVQENFILDYFSVDWNSLINNDKDVNLSFNNFFKRINAILDNHAPLRKVTKKKLRFRSKPWITLGLQKSIFIKNSLFVKFIKSKDINQKNEIHIKYKQYRNLYWKEVNVLILQNILVII